MTHSKSGIETAESNIVLLGDGLLGSAMVDHLEQLPSWDKGATFTHLSRKLGNFDIDCFEDIETIKRAHVIINTIAHTDTSDNSRDTHIKVNYDFAARLADYCHRNGIRLVHYSTDYVYARSKPNAKETDVCVPFSNMYSISKYLADEHIQRVMTDYLIIRTAHKPTPFPFKKGYINVIGSFQDLYNATHQSFDLIIENLIGVYNIGPKEPLSILDFARQTKPKVKSAVYSDEKLPLDTTMSCDKYYDFIKHRYDD